MNDTGKFVVPIEEVSGQPVQISAGPLMDLSIEYVEEGNMVGVIPNKEFIHITGEYYWSTKICKGRQPPIQLVFLAQIND